MEYKFINTSGEHLHTLDGKPLIGTSTVVGIINKSSALTWWASGLAVQSLGWTHPSIKDNQGKVIGKVPLNERIIALKPRFNEIKGMVPEEYLKVLDEAYSAHSKTLKEKASEGTDLHAELEHFVKAEMGKLDHKEKYADKALPAINWLKENVKSYLWSEGNCYSEHLWCGGISDAGVELKNGEYAIVDFKSSKTVYKSQFIQCAGYAMQIEENGVFSEDGKHSKKFDKKFTKVIVFPLGAENPTAEIRADMEDLKKAFINCVELYKFVELDIK